MKSILLVALLCSKTYAGVMTFGDNSTTVDSSINGQNITPASVTASTVTVSAGTGSKCFSADDPTLVVDCNLHKVTVGGSAGLSVTYGVTAGTLTVSENNGTTGLTSPLSTFSNTSGSGGGSLRLYKNDTGAGGILSMDGSVVTASGFLPATVTSDQSNRTSWQMAFGNANSAGNSTFDILAASSGTAQVPVSLWHLTAIESSGGMSGRVGIGTASPATLLHLSSGVTLMDGTGSFLQFAKETTINSQGPSGGATDITDNASYNSGFKYLIANSAANIELFNGSIALFTAVSGAAGGAVTFVDRVHVANGGNVGIADTTPDAELEVLMTGAPSSTTYVMAVSSASDVLASVFGVTAGGHVVSSGTIPGIACNAGTPVIQADSSDMAGYFLAGVAAVNCTVTFQSAWAKKPSCFAATNAATPIALSVAPTTTALVITSLGALTGDTINYFCWGAP